jgi:hypothetical protein
MLAKSESTAAKPSDVRQTIPATKLKALLAVKRKAKNAVGEINGEAATEIKNVTNKYNYSRRVVGWLSVLDNMPPEKLAIELEDLEHGLEASGLNDRAKSAPRLAGVGGTAGDEEQED